MLHQCGIIFPPSLTLHPLSLAYVVCLLHCNRLKELHGKLIEQVGKKATSHRDSPFQNEDKGKGRTSIIEKTFCVKLYVIKNAHIAELVLQSSAETLWKIHYQY